jgi:hypothetical protein
MLGVPVGININADEIPVNIVISNPYNKFLYFCASSGKHVPPDYIPDKWIYQ